MRRAFAPLTVRGKNGEPVKTYQMAGWTKPGTTIDKSIKKRIGYLVGKAYSGTPANR